MKKIKVIYFGALAEVSGKNEEMLEISGNMGSLLDVLKKEYPGLSDKRFIISVNQEICSETKELSDGDEVALLPPFAGG